MARLFQCLSFLGHFRHNGVKLPKTRRRTLRRLPSQRDARFLMIAAPLGHLSNAFPHQRRPIHGALSRKNQVRLAQPLLQTSAFGKHLKTRARFPVQKRITTKAQSPGRAGAGMMRLRPPRLLLEAFRQPRQACFRRAHISFPQSLLRPVNPRSALCSKQGILYVNSRYNLQTFCPADRRNDGLQRRQIRPSNNQFPVSSPELPTKRSSHPKTAVISRAPAKPDQKRRHNLPLKNLRNKDSQTIRIQVKRMKLVRGQLRQSHNLRCFNNRRVRSGNPPPRCPNGLPGGVDRFESPPLPFFLESDGFPKTIPAVTHRNQLQTIPRPNAAPTPRNRSGRFHRSQRSFELIRNNNDLKRHEQTLPKAGQSFQPRHFAVLRTNDKFLFMSPALFAYPTVKNQIAKTTESDLSPGKTTTQNLADFYSHSPRIIPYRSKISFSPLLSAFFPFPPPRCKS